MLIKIVLIDNLNFHIQDAVPCIADAGEGKLAQINDTALYKGASVIDGYNYTLVVFFVGDFYLGSKRQLSMGCGFCVLVKGLPAGSLPGLKFVCIKGGFADFIITGLPGRLCGGLNRARDKFLNRVQA